MNARAVGPRFHCLVAEVTGYNPLGEIRPTAALEAQKVLGVDQDHSRVAAAAR